MPARKRYDADVVKQYAAGRWAEILESVGGIPGDYLDGKHHPCPKCGGKDRFRLVDPEAGSVLCNQCFNKKNGDGFSAIQWSKGGNFGKALQLVGDYLGVAPETTAQSKSRKAEDEKPDPAKNIEFRPWSAVYFAKLQQQKAGISEAGFRAIGARYCMYRKGASAWAIPIWGMSLRRGDPVGWLLLAASSRGLPVYENGPHLPPVRKKSLITYGSRPGVILPEDWQKAEELWKTEGPTDLAAFLSLDLPSSVSGLCNASGAGEKCAPWIAELFRGRRARVIHDADEPGQRGAFSRDKDGKLTGWAPTIANASQDARNVILPYAIAPTHGKDLRDYIASGATYHDLAELAMKASPIEPNSELIKPEIVRSVDDPRRLAEVNLRRYQEFKPGSTIRFWREEAYKFTGRVYKKIEAFDFRAIVRESIEKEFERLYQEEVSQGRAEEGKTFVRKVSDDLVKNTISATAAMTLIPASVELNTYLGDDSREKRNWIVLENGILDVDALVDPKKQDHEILIPHTPRWFSTVCLPYSFDPSADCPKWKAFLRRNLSNDREIHDLLQEWAGYLLTPDTGQQKFMVIQGEGSNGKSVIMACLQAMLGVENCSVIPLENFSDDFSKTMTVGKLLNVSTDSGELDRNAEGMLKAFTSGDRMFFNRKKISGVEAEPTARLMIGCNNKPRFSDASGGLWRRMLLVPLTETISESERVPNMDKIWWWQETGELSGILNWALKGLIRLRERGEFFRPIKCVEALDAYRDERNPARAFLRDYVFVAQGARTEVSTIYDRYQVWCKENGFRPISKSRLGAEVSRSFPNCEKKRGKRFSGGQEDRFYFYEGIAYNPAGVERSSDVNDALDAEF